tara:strand:- start:521 stop:1762 length:1242 start_codon:yes stop_codon:yes gene_type:complete
VEPEVTNQPKINKNTFKIGSGDLQQQVANNTKRIAAVSVLLKSNRRGNAKQLTPTVSNLQETLAESNLILADIAIQLQQDFDSQELREQRLLQKSKEDKLELKRTNKEKDIEYQKTEKKITKTTNKVKGPLDAVFGFLKNILLLFGGLVLVKTLLGTQAGKNLINKITSSEKFQQAKETLDIIFDNLKKGLQAVLVIGGVILGMKLVSTLATIYAVGKGFIAIMANPIVLAGLGILIAMGMQGLGKGEKQVIEDLENMGGFSKENRDKLIEKYKEDRKNLNPLEFGKRSELTEKIRFLEEGKYGYGKGTKFFDFENLEELNALSDVDKLMLNFDPNYDPTAGMRKNKNNGNGVNVVEMPGETINLKGNNNGETNFAKSNVKGTNVEIASSVDVNNRYVSEFPITAGFDDSVYT